MKRRDFLCTSVAGVAGMIGASGLAASANADPDQPQKNACIVKFPKMPGISDHVATFIARAIYEDIPEPALELGKKSLLDALGLALYGATDETWRILNKYTSPFQSKDQGATVLGTNVRLPARFAAFANGVSIHSQDYDDTQLAMHKDRVYGLLTHPTAPVLPAALAIAELHNTTGKELFLAYQLGVEVECKVAEAIAPRHYEDGFHSTGTCGVFGSATACSKLQHFNADQIMITLGLAASQASGLRESFGTMTKPFHAGHAAEAGVVSTDLVALGWTAAPEILEAERGFFHAYGGTYDPVTMTMLGKPWSFESPGISIKPFPSGSLTHPAMTQLLKLIKQHNIKAADVAAVEIGTNKNMPNALIHHQPENALQAKFSMEFCLAILLLERRAGLAQFTDVVVNRSDVQEMIKRVHFVVNAEAEAAGYDKMTSLLKITMRSGQMFNARADFAKGSPADPMSFDEVAEKFMGCADSAKWPEVKAKQIVAAVRGLERMQGVRELTALCRK